MEDKRRSICQKKAQSARRPEIMQSAPYNPTTSNYCIKPEVLLELDPCHENDTIENLPKSVEDMISTIWGAEGTCMNAIAQIQTKIADQDTKITYIVQSIAEINGKFDKLFNYLTQSTPTGPFILTRPPLSPPPPTLAAPPTVLRTLPQRQSPVRQPCPPSRRVKHPQTTPTVRSNCYLRSVQSLQDLDDLEHLLTTEPHFRQGVVDQMTAVHGSRTSTPGRSVALSIVDSFFDRKFLTTCSWTGSGHGMRKITFKRYHSIIEVFHEVVQFSDESFTVEETETFFKQVLRNAVKRMAALRTRKSAKKHRPMVAAARSTIDNRRNRSLAKRPNGSLRRQIEVLEFGRGKYSVGMGGGERNSEPSPSVEIMDDAIQIKIE